jgi:RimJ/RimL family protein N-acetyltransferase
MIIETERLCLRPGQEKDIPELLIALNDWSVVQWLNRLPYPYSEADARDWIRLMNESPTDTVNTKFFIADKMTDELLGGIGTMWQAGNTKAELGYWIKPSVGGKGYMTEAVKALLGNWSKQNPNIQIFASTDPENAKSEKVLLKAGFRFTHTDAIEEPRRRGTTNANYYELIA